MVVNSKKWKCVFFADLYNIPLKNLESIERVDNRLSLRTFADYYILDDAYNSNMLGAIYALEVLASFEGKKYLITPGFAEMDKVKEELLEQYANAINSSCDTVIFVQNDFTQLLAERVQCEVFLRSSFIESFHLFMNIKERNSILLIENDLLE